MWEENRENRPPLGEEITDWYVPRQTDPQEIEGCYVYAHPLPERICPPRQEKHSHKTLWIGLSIAAALVVAAVVLGVVLLSRAHRMTALPDEKDSKASSIINIFDHGKTTGIRRTAPDGSITLTITPPAEELTPQEIYEKVSPATVIVLAQQGEKTTVGTGVIMTADGYILTNAHVIMGGESAAIALYGQYLYEAELVGYDTDTDIAVLKALDAGDFPTAEFGNSDLCRVGDTVYAIGNPLGVELYGTMSDGILSAINRDIAIEGHTVTVLQTTAALNNGNSGGPLINTAGQVIGINTLKMGGGSNPAIAQIEGLGFALPISDASYVVNDILATGAYHGTPTFGITVIGTTDTNGKDVVMIYSLEENGAAAEAGLCEGDVIRSVNGQPVDSVARLLALRRSYHVGDTVSVEIWRGGTVQSYSVTLRGVK